MQIYCHFDNDYDSVFNRWCDGDGGSSYGNKNVTCGGRNVGVCRVIKILFEYFFFSFY